MARHMGFWRLSGLDEAVSLAHQAWATWRIVTETSAELACEPHLSCALSEPVELYCRERAEKAGVQIIEQRETIVDPNAQILDSRPSTIANGQMMQHFIGWEISAEVGRLIRQSPL